MGPVVRIAGREIGPAAPPWVIAEVGVNHNGDPSLALELVDAAAEAGVDAVKFQTFRADQLALVDAPAAEYQKQRAQAASQVEMLRALELPGEALERCRVRASERGIEMLSTPFDPESARILADLGVPAFKIGSGDLTNLLLLRSVARYGLPIILSTGMATEDEVAAALGDLSRHGRPDVVLLHCVSAYPAQPADANLLCMASLRERFGVPVGFSDHTLGLNVAVAAVALGADVIEKHLTMSRHLPGPDHAASLEPREMADLVVAVREAHQARGDGLKRPREAEEELRTVARRSLVVARPIRRGDTIGPDDLIALRPGTGISPLAVDAVIGRRAARSLAAGGLLQPEDVEPPLAGT
ncbi:MAG TPA: N-acetylneuraminate synthase [Gemmatimonadales bacterium]|nr:N-acetylneuraminate synthase [Gemmatimonadales bacterium]